MIFHFFLLSTHSMRRPKPIELHWCPQEIESTSTVLLQEKLIWQMCIYSGAKNSFTLIGVPFAEKPPSDFWNLFDYFSQYTLNTQYVCELFSKIYTSVSD